MNLFDSTIVLSGMKGGNMQDISDLIKEAKPLYFKRKRRNKAIKVGSSLLVLAMLVFAFLPQPQDYSYSSYWDLGEAEYQQISSIEEMGLPVDDYGLLKVS